MPDHVYVLIDFAATEQTINTIAGNGKMFIAYYMIKLLQDKGEDHLISKLSNEIEIARKKNNNKHEVWELHLTGNIAILLILLSRN
jgi:hypothetical protein